jgi:hypothetical protein
MTDQMEQANDTTMTVEPRGSAHARVIIRRGKSSIQVLDLSEEERRRLAEMLDVFGIAGIRVYAAFRDGGEVRTCEG